MTDHKRVYLDYASTTPLDPEVERAMTPYFREYFGNAGSIHAEGQKAQVAVDEARDVIAKALNATWQEIVFTGSATESDNLAIRGVVSAWNPPNGEALGHSPTGEASKKPHVITSTIEHKAILDTCKDLEERGHAEITYINPDSEGMINPKDIEAALTDNTVLVSIMYANNEIGTVQPIAEIAKITKARGIPLHTDAVQAFGYVLCDVEKLGIDLLTLSSHKIYGPKGIGLLYVRTGITISPEITGGDQERGFRAGTENVPGIVGFAKAVSRTEELREEENTRVSKLRNHMLTELQKRNEGIVLQGSSRMRLPNNINIRIPGSLGDTLLILLDQKGIAVSSGSACSAKVVTPSHVILALGKTKEDAANTLRITLGRETTQEDVDYAIEAIVSLNKHS